MVRAVDDLQRGREFYRRRAWVSAHESLSRADQTGELTAPDLESLARSAYMLGRDIDYVGGLERAHHAYLSVGEVLPAVRCAFWIGHNLIFRGERAPAFGWFARAQRFLEREGRDCVERGYLLIPTSCNTSSPARSKQRKRPPRRSSRSATASATRTWSQSD